MPYAFEPMDEAQARAVAAWRYEPPYDFYSLAEDPEDLAELLDPEKRRSYHAALSEGDLVGFLAFGEAARVPGYDYGGAGVLDVGLGMRPDLTGRGLGLGFVLEGLEYGRRSFAPESFRLTVATFNERAIRVYERAGFGRGEIFVRRTGGEGRPFLVMGRAA